MVFYVAEKTSLYIYDAS